MRALLIANPIAGGRGPRREIPDAVAVLQAGGWLIVPAQTEGPGHAARLARQACAEGYDVVLACGGDGTINQVADGLIAAGRENLPAAALGILPAGTGNVLARDLGLPVPGAGLAGTLPAAARLLLQSTPEWIDAGLARGAGGERVFVCWAGVGIDAAITAHVMANPQAKRRFGALYFASSALAHVPQIRNAPHYSIQVDDARWEGRGILAVTSNIQHYAVVIDMAPLASLNDGLLDVVFFRNVDWRNGLGKLRRLATGQHIGDPDVGYAYARRIVIDAQPPQPVHVDAEPFGVTPLTVEVLPRALRLLVPPSQSAKRLVPPGPAEQGT
jgi:YegS/Rv2252/BmrU family lipid kinase